MWQCVLHSLYRQLRSVTKINPEPIWMRSIMLGIGREMERDQQKAEYSSPSRPRAPSSEHANEAAQQQLSAVLPALNAAPAGADRSLALAYIQTRLGQDNAAACHLAVVF